MATQAAIQGAPWTIVRLLGWTREFFAKAGVDEPRLSAEVLLAHTLSCRKIELYTRFESVPSADQLAAFRQLVRTAAEHTPIAYLVGRREFYSLDFEVTPDVLIPRPETETLVERVIEHGRIRAGAGALSVLDVGTGSGCIIVAILKQLGAATGVGCDRSGAALAVARRNAERHGLADRVRFVEADGLALPPESVPGGGFDVLVSNPPYVSIHDWAGLPRSVREHEPRAALLAGEDGLAFFRVLADGAPRLRAGGAAVFVEIGAGQAEAVRSIFTESGAFESGGAWRDRVGGHVRVMEFRFGGHG